MIYRLSKVSRLLIRSFSVKTRNIIYIRVCNKFYVKSPLFVRIMSNIPNVETLLKNNEPKTTETNKQKNISENLIKSENDPMEYRLIQLDNGLRAILVSDVTNLIELDSVSVDIEESEDEEESEEEEEEESDEDGSESSFEEVKNESCTEESESKRGNKESAEKMAACALCVQVGSFSDPDDIPGLAHFLEHMVFMGSRKYPKENGFDEFIKKRGGSDNGSTEVETTVFFLECSEKYLREAMNRFSQFFISPLMKREAMTREREIIHSEFEMYMPSDRTKREQVLGLLAPTGHPAGKFVWGNLTSLRDNIDDDTLYERVHEFRKRHYSAHRMTVAVQGRLPLDTLEQYVRESFSEIPSNGLPAEDFSEFVGTFGDPKMFNKFVWVKPVKDICQIHLIWVLPSVMKDYKSRPLDYIGYMIGHEGDGSLLSLLKRRVWALECLAGICEGGLQHNSIYTLFTVSIIPTEEGFTYMNEIISTFFSYIEMLKKTLPNKDIFDEMRTTSETNFRFKTEVPSASYVEILAESMFLYEPEHYIAGGELFFEYKPDLIMEYLSYLTPDRMNVTIHSSDQPDSFYENIEPWFQTKYKIEEIPAELLDDWKNAPILEELHLPSPNPYLVTDTTLLKFPESNPSYPTKIMNDNLIELWYRQDVKFKYPLAYCFFCVISPYLRSEPINTVLLDMLTSFLETKLVEQLFPANLAGLSWLFSRADYGWFLLFSGYSQKLTLLFDQTLRSIKEYCSTINDPSNEKLFEALKKGRSRSYYNKILKPHKLVKMARLLILIENFETPVDFLNLIEEITLERLQDFAKNFFTSVRILGLVQGNLSKETAMEMSEKFDNVLGCTPLNRERPPVKVTKLPVGELYFRVKSFNESDTNSVIINYYQVGIHELKKSCMIDLIMMVMEEPLFDTLRTKQQIGYDVHCLLRETFGVLGFSVTVFFQINKFQPDEVDERIEAFLKSFSETLRSMSKKEWEETKAALVTIKSSADLELQDEVKRNFEEICFEEYRFDRLKQEVEIVPGITHKEVCDFFDDHIAGGKNFRKLSVQVVGNTLVNCESKSNPEESTQTAFKLRTLASENEKKNLFITDFEEYKKTREFFTFKKKS